MWIATKYGFYSIVRAHATPDPKQPAHTTKEPHPTLMMVRARCRGHLEALLYNTPLGRANHSGIIDNRGQSTDYPFRIIFDASLLPAVMAALGEAVDYTNFKNAAKAAAPEDYAYNTFLAKTWGAGLSLGDGDLAPLAD